MSSINRVTLGTIESQQPGGGTVTLALHAMRYAKDGSLAIKSTHTDPEYGYEEPWGTLSINLSEGMSESPAPWHFYAKTYEENEELAAAALRSALFERVPDAPAVFPNVDFVNPKPAGLAWVNYPLWRLKAEALEPATREAVEKLMGWPAQALAQADPVTPRTPALQRLSYKRALVPLLEMDFGPVSPSALDLVADVRKLFEPGHRGDERFLYTQPRDGDPRRGATLADLVITGDNADRGVLRLLATPAIDNPARAREAFAKLQLLQELTSCGPGPIRLLGSSDDSHSRVLPRVAAGMPAHDEIRLPVDLKEIHARAVEVERAFDLAAKLRDQGCKVDSATMFDWMEQLAIDAHEMAFRSAAMRSSQPVVVEDARRNWYASKTRCVATPPWLYDFGGRVEFDPFGNTGIYVRLPGSWIFQAPVSTWQPEPAALLAAWEQRLVQRAVSIDDVLMRGAAMPVIRSQREDSAAAEARAEESPADRPRG